MRSEAHTRFVFMRAKARTGIWIEALGMALLVFTGFALLSFAVDHTLRLELPYRLALLLVLGWLLLRSLRTRLLRPLGVHLDDDELALAVERRHPDVRQALISAIQFERALGTGGGVVESPALMTAVVDDVRGRLQSIPFVQALDAARVRRFGALLAAGLLLFTGWAIQWPSQLRLWAARNLLLSAEEWPRYTQFRFLPDNVTAVRLPQGDSLTLRVHVDGPVPEQCFVAFAFHGGEKGIEPMSGTGDREFTWTMPSVLENVVLHVEGGDGLSAPVTVQVVERPRLEGTTAVLVFPAYMEKEPEPVPATEGEIKVPRGGSLRLSGRSSKRIEDAFLLFGEKKTALQRDADGFAFHGEVEPHETGLLVVDVLDQDRLGAGQPPKWLVRLADDRGPTLDFKLRGIGQLISTQARIPGDLRVKDDFGLRSTAASIRAQVETVGAGSKPAGESGEPAKAADTPFEPVQALYGKDLAAGSVRYETNASVDLQQVNPNPDENAPANKVRPGMLLSLRFSAKDNFGPKEPHEGFTEVMTFRVVTKEKLIEELRRRQVEQRTELQHVLDEEKTAHTELKEMLNPATGGEKAPLAKARLRALARAQQALGRRAGFIGESYQKILWEFENNRLIEPRDVRELESKITAPLAALAKTDFPATSRLVDGFAASGEEKTRADADAGYTGIEQRILAVLQVMEQAETLAALLEELRVVIKTEDSAIQDVERRLREATERLFGPAKGKDGEKKTDK